MPRLRHQATLQQIYQRPVLSSIKWAELVALLRELGAEFTDRGGSRIAIYLFDEVRVMHRPHPSPELDKGAVVSLRKWLESKGVHP